MKKLFFFLGIALMFIATSCKKNSEGDIVVPVNEGDENTLYTYYSFTKDLCGKNKKDVVDVLKQYEMQSKSATEYTLNKENYIATVSFNDVDDDDNVDFVKVSLVPSELPRDYKMFTYNNILAFAKLVGNETKLLNENVPCRFFGFYDYNKGQFLLGENGYDKFVGGSLQEDYINECFAYWLESTIEKYDPAGEELFTGMYLTQTRVNDHDEYAVELGFAFKQVLK